MNEPVRQFMDEKKQRIAEQGENAPLRHAAQEFLRQSLKTQYSYNFSWMGRPVIQYPQDLLALQEIIWEVRPRLIVETGIAHGGSSAFFASMLELLGGDGIVLAFDIEIRPHNRKAITEHRMAKRIHMLECDSLSETAQQTARKEAERGGPVMVVLDSCHSHAHVLAELELYSKFVTPESYLVVFDGIVEFFPAEAVFPGRPWGAGDNPLTATQAFLQNHPEFEVDTELENKLQITAAPKGWLKRLPDHR